MPAHTVQLSVPTDAHAPARSYQIVDEDSVLPEYVLLIAEPPSGRADPTGRLRFQILVRG